MGIQEMLNLSDEEVARPMPRPSPWTRPFWDDLPYVTAIVDLAEGVRMISSVVECDPHELKNGMELEVVFDDVSPEFTLPKWRPVRR